VLLIEIATFFCVGRTPDVSSPFFLFGLALCGRRRLGRRRGEVGMKQGCGEVAGGVLVSKKPFSFAISLSLPLSFSRSLPFSPDGK